MNKTLRALLGIAFIFVMVVTISWLKTNLLP